MAKYTEQNTFTNGESNSLPFLFSFIFFSFLLDFHKTEWSDQSLDFKEQKAIAYALGLMKRDRNVVTRYEVLSTSVSASKIH